MAACSLKESMMDAVLTVADRWSNPESRYVLNLSGWNDNNLPSSPNGSTFIFSVMLDSASVAGSDVMPITVGGPSLKLLDKTGLEIDKAGAIKAYRGVRTWYKFTLYKIRYRARRCLLVIKLPLTALWQMVITMLRSANLQQRLVRRQERVKHTSLISKA